ncbi:MAG: SGNH/GDSL hydrolase family protein [Bacteroidales bacterium]|nr:SGNH/GDSL hydrolase family protein [Bacteroidales bacterium]MBN2633726.1 SGNH/GDSL hydrolase family protein [Bacteroidales bacterium]
MEQGQESLKYLALGDSYTIGEGVDRNLLYPVQISDSLGKRGYFMAAPEIIAVTGWTTSDLKDGIRAANPQRHYDLVSLLIGVNNQYRGMDINIYRKEFGELIDQSIFFAGNDTGRVIVFSIPDWGVTPFASGRDRKKIAREIDQYNAINKEITLSKGIVWINVTGISRLAENDPALIASDGLHPSGRMYTEWVSLALPEILKMLKEE